ncbi:hypothetical protein PsYK624_140330 [Phanerochaete sordida]|uniref:Uncharacterized protein n=1 Tax=Phanerochaete sordida TaxID=48140 RepID=A0A9P3LJS0_9APHY|nr:hypothetical protein PsYK624_140330 [Phanerochaete sordida]
MVYPFQILVEQLASGRAHPEHTNSTEHTISSLTEEAATSSASSIECILPLELWELIVDHLADDTHALLACALTCSALLSRSRHHLYRRITLLVEEDANNFVQALVNDPRNWGAVHELAVPSQLLCARDGNATPHLFQMLPNLRTLVLYRLQQHAYGHLRTCLAPVQHSITAFSLCAAHITSFSLLAALVSSFPRLQHLTLHDITFMEDVDVARVDAYAPQLALQTLDFRNWALADGTAHMRAMLLWVGRVSRTTLSVVRLHLPLDAGLRTAIQHVLDANRATLHTLILDFGSSYSENIGLQLAGNTALRRLQVHVRTYGIPTCEHLLRHLPDGTALEDLSLVFHAPRNGAWFGAAAFVEIARLRPVLARAQFAGLRRFLVRCSYGLGATYYPPQEDFYCKELVLREWLPDVSPDVWADGLEETFEHVFER